jgi:NSS family neurotransmitter:Na+ symporter
MRGDVGSGLAFAFAPYFAKISPQVLLAAVGQAFYATGVGQAMMLAYGSYLDPHVSLLRTAFSITGSILLVSLLATVIIFPLVFGYGLNPAQGPELVFEVLPRAFAEMSGGRVAGTLFFLLLVLAALMPSIALLEPSVAWLIERRRIRRMPAVLAVAGFAWLLGLGSVLSFNFWSHVHPLAFLPGFANKTLFDDMDFIASNVLLPVGALLTSVLLGWRVGAPFWEAQRAGDINSVTRACLWLLRYLCPIAIGAVLVANLF